MWVFVCVLLVGKAFNLLAGDSKRGRFPILEELLALFKMGPGFLSVSNEKRYLVRIDILNI